ncbi:hypothetical protein GCM10010330_15570 [Streptomyces tendae]|uniref:hypothetical protein n=1 Tax=Streptomyces tendae TaxID=1932 RepID=UPI00198B7F36|nr:hypothetical protein [Streptomyces tendae]GHA63694.1 hypothetical protein GCM10010330_15570 [Streptomyces tendae]
MPLHAGEHRAVGPRRTGARRSGPDRRRIRLYGLAGVVVCAVVLPFAVASAGPSGDADAEVSTAVPLLARGGDDKASASSASAASSAASAAAESAPVVEPGDHFGPGSGGAGRVTDTDAAARSPLPPGPALAARCGPELTSPAGVEAQTCVLTRGSETWARTYYRNATGGPLEAVLSLMGPDGHSVRTSCAVSVEDAPGTCETPPEDTGEASRGGLEGYTAFAEFARRAGYGPLLLRAGSAGSAGDIEGGDGGHDDANSPADTGS